MRRDQLGGVVAVLLVLLALGAPGETARAETPTPKAFPNCPARPIACNQIVDGTLDASDCFYPDTGRRVEFWEFHGTAGREIEVDQASFDLDSYVLLYDPRNQVVDFDDDSGPGLDARLFHVLPETGTWMIGATSYRGNSFGTYALSLACGAQTCTADQDTLCLQNGRFRVEATYATPSSGSGIARAVALTGDTGYLWFFNSANVEAVVKVLNACGVNGRYWVFAGGLTDVRVEITVTDTTTGAVKRYTNPQGTVWRTITDTGAFATCP